MSIGYYVETRLVLFYGIEVVVKNFTHIIGRMGIRQTETVSSLHPSTGEADTIAGTVPGVHFPLHLLLFTPLSRLPLLDRE